MRVRLSLSLRFVNTAESIPASMSVRLGLFGMRKTRKFSILKKRPALGVGPARKLVLTAVFSCPEA
jgi:hypothetical protein